MTKEYALVGHPLEHSISKEYFTTKFETEGIDARYINLDLSSLNDLQRELRRHPHLLGFNVTSPYKTEIKKFLYSIDQEAEYIGAVNTVIVQKGFFSRRKLYGFNTDIIGFSESIKPLLKANHTRALILGTGGASKAVQRAFKIMRIDCDTVSRKESSSDSMGYDRVDEAVIKSHKIIVNASPVGMYPNMLIAPPIPYEAITPEHLCFDLIYSPEETLFLSHAKAMGATIKNGADMLVIQAEESWKIWQSRL